MLKLHSLELIGFKSFADRAKVEFPDHVTAIVGPNGCGKSNLSDALRFVLLWMLYRYPHYISGGTPDAKLM